MSLLSRLLGLDKKPAELAAINAIGSVVLHNVESEAPIAAKLVSVLEAVGDHLPATPMSAVSAVGTVVAVFDPELIAQVDGKVNAVITEIGKKLGADDDTVKAEIAAADAAINALLEAVGAPAPTA